MPGVIKTICLRGHNVSILGRSRDYSCNACSKEDEPKNARKPRYRYTASRFIAKRRNIEWDLTFEQYIPLILLPCEYCGGPLPETSCGLDRIDNSKGYTITNVVPCCKICNVMKNNLTKEQFMLRIKQIYSRLFS